MTTTGLEQPVTGGAIRSVHFFNGRLLTGEDLAHEQEVALARLARLGRIAGAGVATGLEVAASTASGTATHPVVTVQPGVALTHSGLALELLDRVDVSLAREAATATSEPGGLFADCQPFSPGAYTAGAGVYLLAIGPATASEGRAAVSGLGNDAAPCNTAWSVEAVRFRLVRLALDPTVLGDAAHLRNRVAHLLFGTGSDELARLGADPFGLDVTGYGLLDELQSSVLTEDEVPLCTIGWTADGGIAWVDRWAARRRVTRPAGAGRWSAQLDDRRTAVAEAAFLQFQEELDDLRRQSGSPGPTRAGDHFATLPPAGLVPVGDTTLAKGFQWANFFDGMKVRGPVFIEGARLAHVLSTALHYPAIDPTSGEAIWLYQTRENAQAADRGAQAFLVFATAHTPYEADGQYDLSHWNLGNYAISKSPSGGTS